MYSISTPFLLDNTLRIPLATPFLLVSCIVQRDGNRHKYHLKELRGVRSTINTFYCSCIDSDRILSLFYLRKAFQLQFMAAGYILSAIHVVEEFYVEYTDILCMYIAAALISQFRTAKIR